MVLCYKITYKYKELLPFLLYLMIASIYYENNYFLSVVFAFKQQVESNGKLLHIFSGRIVVIAMSVSNKFALIFE